MDRTESVKAIQAGNPAISAEWDKKCEPGLLPRIWNYTQAVNREEGFYRGTLQSPYITEAYKLYNAESWSSCLIEHRETDKAHVLAFKSSLPMSKTLANYGEFNAELTNTRGYSGKAVVDTLRAAGIDIPESNARDIKEIPGMQQMPNTEKLQPGDVVVLGPQTKGGTHISQYGNAFIVTNDFKAANDHISNIPDLATLNDVKLFRAKSP